MMTWFDWLAALILVALAVRGYGRGLILQLAAVVAVALGLLGGLYLHSGAATMLPDIGHPILTLVAGFTVVFVAVALSVNFLARALKAAVDALFLGIVDRLLGAVLGIVVGVQLVMLIVLLVGRYLPDGLAWMEATRTAPLLSGVFDFVLPLLPDHFLEFFERHGGSPGDWLEPLDELRREGEQLLDGIRRDAI
ncbi:MAG: CvpA family protein [Candidatus Latescibacterota bacterium]